MKTLNQLIKIVSFSFSGYGHYKVTIIYRGKEYKCTTTNIEAIDAAKEGDNEKGRPTRRQAFLRLYNEVKQANNLR
jgi:hypothetical protein